MIYYDIFCALLYTLKNECVCAVYPAIFLNGKPSIITGYFGLKRHHLLGSLPWIRVKKIVGQQRLAQKRSVCTSFIILDAQSVKNTDPAESSGYDGGKKVCGIKRHLAVDINGLPMAVHVTIANVSERDSANALLALNKLQFDLVQRVRSCLRFSNLRCIKCLLSRSEWHLLANKAGINIILSRYSQNTCIDVIFGDYQ
ncbi:transposase [Lactiplantibacillus plantarum]